jgi:hypothetical protein
MGCGSGMTCWRRLRDWQAAGVFERLHRALLDRLGRANAIDFGRCSLDSASFPAKRGASSPARTRPTAASRHQAPRHRRRDGVPLALLLSAANVHDSRLLEPLLDAVPPIRQCAGRPRKRPASCTRTKGTTTITAAWPHGAKASSPALPAEVSRARTGWAATAG